MKVVNKKIKTRSGKYVTRRVQIKANGQWKFLKGKARATTKSSSTGKKRKLKVKKSSKSSPKNSGGTHMRRIYIAPVMGAIAVPLALGAGVMTKQLHPIEAAGKFGAAYTGYNPVSGQWEPSMAFANYGAIAAGTIASIIASKVGLNKRLPRGFNI